MTASTEQLDYQRITREEEREARQRARDRRRSWQAGAFAVGRVFLGLVFIGSAAGMLADYPGTVASLQETLFDVHHLVPLAIGFQLLFGTSVLIGLRARAAALLGGVYLVVTLLLAPPDLGTDLGRAIGFANLGLLAALAMIGAHGAGRLSVDHVLGRRRRLHASHRLAGRAHEAGSRVPSKRHTPPSP